LFNHGADVRASDDSGGTPLHRAACHVEFRRKTDRAYTATDSISSDGNWVCTGLNRNFGSGLRGLQRGWHGRSGGLRCVSRFDGRAGERRKRRVRRL
jgi:hypothetical protein